MNQWTKDTMQSTKTDDFRNMVLEQRILHRYVVYQRPSKAHRQRCTLIWRQTLYLVIARFSQLKHRKGRMFCHLSSGGVMLNNKKVHETEFLKSGQLGCETSSEAMVRRGSWELQFAIGLKPNQSRFHALVLVIHKAWHSASWKKWLIKNYIVCNDVCGFGYGLVSLMLPKTYYIKEYRILNW